jgi:hypothetical protein
MPPKPVLMSNAILVGLALLTPRCKASRVRTHALPVERAPQLLVHSVDVVSQRCVDELKQLLSLPSRYYHARGSVTRIVQHKPVCASDLVRCRTILVTLLLSPAGDGLHRCKKFHSSMPCWLRICCLLHHVRHELVVVIFARLLLLLLCRRSPWGDLT